MRRSWPAASVGVLLLGACATDAPQATLPEGACPAPGSMVETVRASDGVVNQRLIYVASPRKDGPGGCYVRQGVEGTIAVNLAARPLAPRVEAAHAAVMARIHPYEPGRTARGFGVNDVTQGGGTAQFEMRYSILGRERVTVPAGTFETLLVSYVEVNAGCIVEWRSWIERDTWLPVKGSTGSSGDCARPHAEEWVAIRVSGAARRVARGA